MKSNTITYNPQDEEKARYGWYLHGRDKFVLRLVAKFADLNLSKILDAGCGTGGVISGFPNRNMIVGNDMSLESLVWGKKRKRIINGFQASIINLPFRDEIFDISITSEVLEHLDDDLTALKELHRVTKNRIILTVPAHKYLWTDSDNILLHKRRYSKSELMVLIQNSGMRVIKLKPYGMIPALLVIAYKIFKKIKPTVKDTFMEEDLPLASRFRPPCFVENTLRSLFLFDLWLSSKGLIPWGHSWWACVENNLNFHEKTKIVV